jgi:hypothetical protein
MVATMLDRSRVADQLIALLQPHTPFAEAIVKRQAERAGLDLARLEDTDLVILGPMILKAASTFVDPAGLAQLRRQLGR